MAWTAKEERDPPRQRAGVPDAAGTGVGGAAGGEDLEGEGETPARGRAWKPCPRVIAILGKAAENQRHKQRTFAEVIP